MRKQFLLIVGMACTLGMASGATFINENFEGATSSFGTPQTTAGVIAGSAFSLISGSIDINGPGTASNAYGQLCRAPASSKCIDTTGGGQRSRGVFESTSGFTFLMNVQYALSFSLVRWDDTDASNPGAAGLQDTKIQVTLGGIGGLVDNSYTTDSTWINKTVTVFFIPSSTLVGAKLRFTDLGVANSTSYAGAIVDNVNLGDTSSIPEPATFAFVGLGVAALAATRRKRA